MSGTTYQFRDELRGIAKALGLSLEEGKIEVAPELRPSIPLFAHWSVCENRLSRTIDGVAAVMFELTTINRARDDAQRDLWTVIKYSVTPFPPFCLYSKIVDDDTAAGERDPDQLRLASVRPDDAR